MIWKQLVVAAWNVTDSLYVTRDWIWKNPATMHSAMFRDMEIVSSDDCSVL